MEAHHRNMDQTGVFPLNLYNHSEKNMWFLLDFPLRQFIELQTHYLVAYLGLSAQPTMFHKFQQNFSRQIHGKKCISTSQALAPCGRSPWHLAMEEPDAVPWRNVGGPLWGP